MTAAIFAKQKPPMQNKKLSFQYVVIWVDMVYYK
jgi:hypothetical protein